MFTAEAAAEGMVELYKAFCARLRVTNDKRTVPVGARPLRRSSPMTPVPTRCCLRVSAEAALMSLFHLDLGGPITVW